MHRCKLLVLGHPCAMLPPPKRDLSLTFPTVWRRGVRVRVRVKMELSMSGVWPSAVSEGHLVERIQAYPVGVIGRGAVHIIQGVPEGGACWEAEGSGLVRASGHLPGTEQTYRGTGAQVRGHLSEFLPPSSPTRGRLQGGVMECWSYTKM